ncbi:T9SS type A sorting domain-containing protein [Flavobacterium sp. SUN052]|uniref:T9SS type A sorting domain-containing protein n=1 Tax=Flavobacterium sp. SUN052 TaxID=3002441 RepID=UPI00237E9552|nr:T9SS type A sorting domain-containing protein [Flavobacterium sp. SUN052]MEC4005454.1 T9SS type A sorting domain-containing protein [Flavobacterium sp. SUN052]
MKNVVIIVLLITYCCNINAQTPTIEWQNTIGGNQIDRITDISQTTDGGYIIGGYSNSVISRDKTEQFFGTFDFWIVKLNAVGTIVWQNTIKANGINSNTLIKETTDGGFIVIGASSSNIAGDKTINTKGVDDIWLLKLNNIGTIVWQKSIGGSNADQPMSLNILTNNNILIGAISASSISGDKSDINYGIYDYWVLELDESGTILWQKTLGGSSNETLTSFNKTTDNGYIIGGYSSSGISGNKTENCYGQNDFWIVKLDSDKNILWQKTIGGTEIEQCNAVIEMVDNGFLIGGNSSSGISGNKTEPSKGADDFWVIKLNSLGEIIWQKTIGGTTSDGIASIDKTIDGNFLLAGTSSSPISGDKTENSRGLEDIWLVKIDENGTILWDKTIGGNDQDYNIKIQSTPDNGIIIGSNSKSSISGEKTEIATGQDYWIIKLSPDNLSNNTLDSSLFSIYPNPTTGVFNIKFNSTFENYTITIRNYLGQIVKQENISTINTYTNSIETQSGFYFIELENKNHQKITFKIIKI